MAVVGGHKLTGKSFEGLKLGCEISDEVWGKLFLKKWATVYL
jgi:hypothetical protein